MRVTKDDLKNYGLFDSLPEPLKNMEAGSFFVFYYDVDEDNIKLKIYEYDVLKQINVSVYRGSNDKANKYNTLTMSIGFFSDTFETKDGLFYQFLRTFNDAEAVSIFYSNAVEQDRSTDVSISTNAITQIYTSDDFRRSISYFSPSRLQTIMFVYDMVNNAFKSRLSKDLYGESLKKVVNLIKFDGGVLPEMGGVLRYMIIGENANLTPEQAEKLAEAKILLRSLNSIDKVYQHTGWCFSDRDGKWRTNIADNDAYIDNALLYDCNGRKLYIPVKGDKDDTLALVAAPNKLNGVNYGGRLIDVLKHPTLYQYYPRLALLPLLYYYGENESGLKSNFYFSPDGRGGFIVICGHKKCGDSLSILLHEVQHYIQNVESYATGGNLFLARFVASVGGAMVRKIFASINKMERFFREDLFNNESKNELIEVIKSEIGRTPEARELKNMLLELFNTDDYFNQYKAINFYLILFVAENGDFSTNGVTLYLQDKLGDIVFELFENISEGYDGAKNYKQKLASEGYKDEDIKRILFSSYQNLYGEIESRSVQSSRFVGSEFKNYFYLTKWENSPIQQISIIDGIENVIDCTKIKAAVEDKDGEYVLHFERNISCVPILHELGHIVHDALNTLGYKDKIEEGYMKNYTFDDVNEYFVSRFLGYLKDNVDDEKLKQDLKMDFSVSSETGINEILDEFFADVKVMEKLSFLKTMLSS